jgi:hypothetical protein
MESKQFEQAVKDFEEAVRLQDDPQARELLQQAQKGLAEARKAAYDQAMLRITGSGHFRYVIRHRRRGKSLEAPPCHPVVKA